MDAQHALLTELDRLIARGPPSRVVFALPGGRPPLGAAMVPGARLSYVTAGCKHIQAWDGQRAIDHQLAAGEAMVMPPYGWTLPCYDTTRDFLGIVRHRDFTRFLYSQYHVGSRTRSPQTWFHTARPMRPGATQALGALAALALGGPPIAAQQLWIFLHFAREELSAPPRDRTDRARQTWNALCEHVQEHLAEDLGRDQLARRFRLHPSYVSLLFSRIGGETFGSYVTRLRLERAQRLLGGELTITDIAQRCGFHDPSHFIKVFRRALGCTPGRWSGRRSDGEVQAQRAGTAPHPFDHGS